MVEAPIPQDILKYKPKFIMNFSVRETVFGALAIGLGLLSYFLWTPKDADQTLRMTISFCVILPFFLIGFVKIYEQPFEKIAVSLIMENFIYPAKRKREVHFPSFEKYEKTREWMLKEEQETQEETEEIKGKKSKKKQKTQKVKIEKSAMFVGIK